MKICDIVSFLESLANPVLQEHYDNAGLIAGQADWNCTGIICSLDATEDVVQEAIHRKCNMIVAHHPIIFSGLKKINGKNYVEKTIISAIKNDIAIYAIHTNLDNVITGVTGKMAAMLGLQNITILSPKENTLKKLYTFAPVEKSDQVRAALFAAGAGNIGNYSETSFNGDGTGTFKAGKGANPFVGDIGTLHYEKETKIEVLFPAYFEKQIISALLAAHPYEEVAYDIINLSNTNQKEGSGVLGELPATMDETAFLMQLKQIFKLKIIRHTPLLNRPLKKVALCGGAGSFLISKALAAGADILVTADMKYHEFFDANSRIIIADIGHYESEQFTIDLLAEFLEKKFPTFAVLKTRVETNPVRYF